MNPLISVIIPAFNAEKTIEKCIKSIQKQTYNNLEIIVVNDGSSDATEAIVVNLKNNDNKIKLFSIPNRGVSHARNIGIEKSKGEYITFVDSDDYIDAEMYSDLIKLIQNYNAQIAHCSYKNIDANGKVISVVGNNDRISKQKHDEAMECLITGVLFAGGLCNKLYDSKLFYGCRLDENISINEDVLLNVLLFDKSDIIVYTDAPYYNYVAYENSSTHSTDMLSKGEQGLYVSRKIYDYSIGKSFESVAELRVARSLMGLYREYIILNDKAQKESKKALLNEIIDFRKKGFYKNRRENLIYFMCRYCPRLFSFLYSKYDRIRVKKLDPVQ